MALWRNLGIGCDVRGDSVSSVIFEPEEGHSDVEVRPRRGATGKILRDAQPGYCVALGGDGTAGRFVAESWPRLLERLSGRMVLNFAAPHSGLDAMLVDGELLRVAAGARLRLIEIPNAINLTNPFYKVHLRRNERIVAATPLLGRLYPEVDFTEFSFTRHMILRLWEVDRERFMEVSKVLSQVWSEKIELLLDKLEGASVLIWWGNRPPLAKGDEQALLPGAPMLVDAEMIMAVREMAEGLVELVTPDHLGGAPQRPRGPLDVVAARELPGAESHSTLAARLLPWLYQLAPLDPPLVGEDLP